MTRRPRDIRRLTAVVTAAVFAVLVAVVVPGEAVAFAAGGTWGAGAYPYLTGKICTTEQNGTPATTPLTSWDLGDGRSPAFLTSSVVSNGTTDSAAPPLPSVGTQTVSPVTAGVAGFTSETDIATYATLLARFGNSSAADAARVADAVLRKATGASPGCVDSAAESALLQQAQRLAGPYTLTFADQPTSLLPGTSAAVRVTLTSAAGQPVPGATVTFRAHSLQLSAMTATTDASGVATVQAQAPQGLRIRNLSVTASAALPTGLQQVNAQTTPSDTDPTGAVASALVAAPPTPVTARKTVRLNLSAHPVMRLSLPDQALDLGAATTPHAIVTGMFGHSATVSFTIRGPARLGSGTFCAGLSRADFGSAVAATSTVRITGDSTIDAGRWQPTKTGCYSVSARLTTLDAVPQAVAHASAATPITVLDTSVALRLQHTLVRAGSEIVGKAVTHHNYGLGGTLDVRMVGPVRPPAGASTCAGADYSSASPVGSGTDAVAADARAPSASFTIRAEGVGCYQLTGALRLRLPGGGIVRVPVSDGASPALLAVDPGVSYAMDRSWSFPRGQVSAHVTVLGTFNQPVHVALRMLRVPDADLLCRTADYSAPSGTLTGPAVAARANLATVAVRSGPLPEPGCYEAVPVLTMDGNRAITATGSFDALTSAVAVGVDPNAHQAVVGSWGPHGRPDLLREVAAGAGFLLLCLLAFGYAVRKARRMARALFLTGRDELFLP